MNFIYWTQNFTIKYHIVYNLYYSEVSLCAQHGWYHINIDAPNSAYHIMLKTWKWGLSSRGVPNHQQEYKGMNQHMLHKGQAHDKPE